MNDNDMRKLSRLDKLRRLDARRSPALRGVGPDSDETRDANDLPPVPGSTFDHATTERGFYKKSEEEACRVDQQNVDPQNLAIDGQYFWDDERRCLITADGKPVAHRRLS